MNPNNKKTLIATGLLALVFGLGSLVITPTSESNQQANIFQSIKNIFSKKDKVIEPPQDISFGENEFLTEEESIEDFKEKLFNPNVIYAKLTSESSVAFRQNGTLPQALETIAKQNKQQKVSSTVNPIKNPTHPVSYWVTFQFPSFEDAQNFFTQAHNVPQVTNLELDWKQETNIVPNDEFYQPDSAESLWGHDMINVQALWDVIENPGEGIVVGVLDTGISNSGNLGDQYTHADLVGSEWYNTDEIPDNGIDDDNNGYVDDYLGGFALFSFPSYEDKNGHGTHVAGTIGARGNNQIGLPGIAFESTLMPFKFSNGGSWSVQTSLQGLVYATDNSADVINNSWGGDYSEAVADAVLYAHEADVVVVSSAGNNYGMDVCRVTPAGSEYSIAVSAVNPDGDIAQYSNIGTGVDLAAPGGNTGGQFVSDQKILSTRTRYPNPVIDVVPVVYSQGNEYISIDGTSMATPHVAAAAAIIRQQRPTWNNEQVYAALKWITDDTGEYFADGYGHGILDMAKILDLPDVMPVAQLYSPRNCTSFTQVTQQEPIEVVLSAYVPGAPTPDSTRLEIAEGVEVSDVDFELVAELSGETVNGIGYMLDISDFDFGTYTLRVVTEYGGVVVEDRNRFGVVKGWDLISVTGSNYSDDGYLSQNQYVWFENSLGRYDVQAGEIDYQPFVSSTTVSASADGRYVAFNSLSSNLVPGDTNGEADVFVHDRETGITEMVSLSSEGIQGDHWSYTPSISADGRYVAFNSWSSNLVPGDTNNTSDIFVHDRETGITEMVSVDIEGGLGLNESNETNISVNGQYIVFDSTSYNFPPYNTTNRRVFLVKLWDDPEYCPYDLNDDGVINTGDLALLLGNFDAASCENCLGDFNSDGIVNSGDLAAFLPYYGQECPVDEPQNFNPVLTSSIQIIEPQTLESVGVQYNTILTLVNPTKQIQKNQTISLSSEFTKFITDSISTKRGVAIDSKQGIITIPELQPEEEITFYLNVTLDEQACSAGVKGVYLNRWCK